MVRTIRQGDTVSLAVEDDGVGIPDRDLERIFEPFFTTKPAGKGTGLGLFVALGIARKHGGTLTAGRRPGRGTRLQLMLPVFRT